MPKARKGRLKPIEQFPTKGVVRLSKHGEKLEKPKGVEIHGKSPE
jgi:hypothetical protein